MLTTLTKFQSRRWFVQEISRLFAQVCVRHEFIGSLLLGLKSNLAAQRKTTGIMNVSTSCALCAKPRISKKKELSENKLVCHDILGRWLSHILCPHHTSQAHVGLFIFAIPKLASLFRLLVFLVFCLFSWSSALSCTHTWISRYWWHYELRWNIGAMPVQCDMSLDQWLVYIDCRWLVNEAYVNVHFGSLSLCCSDSPLCGPPQCKASGWSRWKRGLHLPQWAPERVGWTRRREWRRWWEHNHQRCVRHTVTLKCCTVPKQNCLLEVDRLWFFNANTDYWMTKKADTD